LLPLTLFYFSPYLPVLGAIGGIVAGSVLVFCIMFLLGIFIGKAPCGWIMGCGGLQEACFYIQNMLDGAVYDTGADTGNSCLRFMDLPLDCSFRSYYNSNKPNLLKGSALLKARKEKEVTMKKMKKVRGYVFTACLMLGAALLSIDAYTDFGNADKKNQDAEKTSKTLAEIRAEEHQALFIKDKIDTYAASRGDSLRNTDDLRMDQPEGEPVEPAAKPATAPEKPAAKPAPAPAKPAAKPAPAPAPAPAKAASGYEYELDLLARLITAEAQGQPYEAKVAVGAVVMNRVKSGQWAGTIKDVIYQKFGQYYQFTPVETGWINNPAEPESIKAAKAAMAGADPTNGAQFYYDDTVTNEWILAKPVSIRIGRMTYAY